MSVAKSTATQSRRLARERETVAAMIRIYCRGRHAARRELCEECEQLHAYAMCRLDRCPFGAEKPTCANCPVHCYKPDRREQIREVMRYAGPRMLWRHPILALFHLLDGGKQTLSSPPRKQEPNQTPPEIT
jgi:hypothetical protein